MLRALIHSGRVPAQHTALQNGTSRAAEPLGPCATLTGQQCSAGTNGRGCSATPQNGATCFFQPTVVPLPTKIALSLPARGLDGTCGMVSPKSWDTMTLSPPLLPSVTCAVQTWGPSSGEARGSRRERQVKLVRK